MGHMIELALTLLLNDNTDPEPPIQYIISPHEDDEFEMWSLVENVDTFKVFIVLAAGESTGFCATASLAALDGVGEIAPTPTPQGRFTESCTDARQSSWVHYFEQMSLTDPSIPGNFEPDYMTRQFPTDREVCRMDDDKTCTVEDHAARVWVDVENRGVLVAFNIGEGDETPAEIDWVIRTVMGHPHEFNIPTAPVWGVIGGYANTDPACAVYAHPDHVALGVALARYSYDVPVQGSAVCASNANMHAQVTATSMTAAFAMSPTGERLGAHNMNYGWLHWGTYELSPYDQSLLFHGAQTFRLWSGRTLVPAV